MTSVSFQKKKRKVKNKQNWWHDQNISRRTTGGQRYYASVNEDMCMLTYKSKANAR